MQSIHIDQIVIREDRQRQDFDGEALYELTQSIRDRGLMHPPVLRRDGADLVLVAGERRLRAIRNLWALGGKLRVGGTIFDHEMVPYTDFGDLSDLEAEECELDENLKRRDLTWQEHAQAVARLHRLRERQMKTAVAEASGGMHSCGGSTWTVADTAKEVRGRTDGSFLDDTRKELIVARYLDGAGAKPEVAKAKSVDEAFKILKAEEDRERNIALAASIGEEYTSEVHVLRNEDCLTWLQSAALDLGRVGGGFDVILTDPPYGMGADSFGDAAGKLTTIQHHYDDSPESWRNLMSRWAPLAYAIAKPQAHAYVFCDFDRFHELKGMMHAAGWYVFRTPFIVHKINSGRVPLPDRGPRRSWECLLYAIKGDKPVTHIYPDVIPCQGDDNMGHGAQKPVALYSNLLQRSCRPGDRVLDTFAGTGTIFAAAHPLKLYATGVEVDPGSYGIALNRLKGLDQ